MSLPVLHTDKPKVIHPKPEKVYFIIHHYEAFVNRKEL